MNYKIVKLSFEKPVHFGEKRLSDSNIPFKSDSFYSALMIEAVKIGKENEFFTAVKNGSVALSDLFPYKEDKFFLPKPNINLPYEMLTNKTLKNLKFISLENMPNYILGNFDVEKEAENQTFGEASAMEKISLQGEESEPYVVGVFRFEKNCGLYFIIQATDTTLFDQLLCNLQYVGIGGKKASGYGQFSFEYTENKTLEKALLSKGSKKLLLSTAMMQDVPSLQGARYKLIKRGGIIDSATYSQTLVKKKDIYAFEAGSTFDFTFEGDVFTVGTRGNHEVYRFLKPLFLEFGGVK